MHNLKHATLFLFLFSLHGFGQDLSDQITNYLNGSVDDKVTGIMQFHNKLDAINNDTVLFFIRDLQDVGIESGREDAIAMSNYVFGHYLNDNSLFNEAYTKLKEAERYYTFVELDSMICVVHNALGNNFFLQSERNKAEEYYLSSIDFGKRVEDPSFENLSYSNLARIFIGQEKYKEAKQLLDDYIIANEKVSHIRNLGTAYGVYGQLYLNQNKFDEAIDKLERSMEYNLATGNNELIGNGYTNMAIAAYFQEDYVKAKSYFELALAYREKEGKPYYIAESYYNLGDFFFGINELDSAQIAYQNSLEIARNSANLVGEKDALMQLSVLYDSIDQPENEVEMLRKYIEVERKLNKEQITRELATLRLSFEQELQQKDYLTQQREKELRKQIDKVDTVWDYWLWIVMVFVLTIAGFVFIAYRKTNQGS